MFSQLVLVGIAHVQPLAGLWRSACAGRRAAQGVKGESTLARAVVTETFAHGKGFCKHGCRAYQLASLPLLQQNITVFFHSLLHKSS